MSFSKENIKDIRNDIISALKKVEQKHGVLFNLGRITYYNTDFRASLQCHTNDDGAKSPIELEWNKLCHSYGFKGTDLHEKVNLNGEVHQIIGLKSRNRKYPIITKKMGNGKQYKWTSDSVLRALQARGK
jgi:hypothetical protein